MNKTQELTPDDLIIKERLANRKRRGFVKRKIVECPYCGIININAGNSHRCSMQWGLEKFDS